MDTPGFGDAVDNSSCWEPVLHYVESQYEAFLEAETKVCSWFLYFCETVVKSIMSFHFTLTRLTGCWKYYVISFFCVHFISIRLPETPTWRTAEFTRVSTLWRRRVTASELYSQLCSLFLSVSNWILSFSLFVYFCNLVYCNSWSFPGLKPLDIEFMKQLHDKINIIPVIGKADTMTPEEVNRPFS